MLKAEHKKFFSNGKEMYIDFSEKDDFYANVWLHLYKRTFLLENNITFIENLNFEDQPFSVQVYMIAGQTIYIDQILYTYRIREGSIVTSKNNEKNIFDNFRLTMFIHKFIEKYNLSGDVLKWIKYRMTSRLNYTINRFRKLDEEAKNRILSMCSSETEKREFFYAVENVSGLLEIKDKKIAQIQASQKKEIEKLKNARKKEINGIKSGYSYKIGRIITFVPRKIRDVLKKIVGFQKR